MTVSFKLLGLHPAPPWPPEMLTGPLPHSHSTALPSGRSVQHWMVVSEFQYRPSGPVIYFLNEQLLDAVVSAFLPQARSARWRRSAEARNNVTFQPISREDVLDNQAPRESLNLVQGGGRDT